MEILGTDLTYWHWLIFGVLLGALEIFAPTSFLLWPAIAAIITAAITWLLPAMGWQVQLVLFALLSVLVTLTGRYFYTFKSDSDNSHPTLNRRGESIKGRKITLDKPMINGVGSAIIDDTHWRLVGSDFPEGTTLIVTGTEGSSLTVSEDIRPV